MKVVVDSIKSFEASFGWIIRWFLLVVVAYAILYADSRYLLRSEVEAYMEKFHMLRKDDMSMIYGSIDKARTEAIASDTIVRSLEGRFSRLEAQNEMIIKQLERLQTPR